MKVISFNVSEAREHIKEMDKLYENGSDEVVEKVKKIASLANCFYDRIGQDRINEIKLIGQLDEVVRLFNVDNKNINFCFGGVKFSFVDDALQIKKSDVINLIKNGFLNDSMKFKNFNINVSLKY